MKFIKAEEKYIKALTAISKKAFDSDVLVGGSEAGGPPDYDSPEWHDKMREEGHLFQAMEEDVLVGGAVLFLDETGSRLFVGRIFIDNTLHRKGYGTRLMECAESFYPCVKEVHLDTPIWNIRTNSFYQKLGYVEEKRDEEFIYYKKIMWKSDECAKR